MKTPLLQTKLYIPAAQPDLVSHPRLIERLNKSLHHTTSVNLISTPADFVKTALVVEWLQQADCRRPGCRWLKLGSRLS